MVNEKNSRIPKSLYLRLEGDKTMVHGDLINIKTGTSRIKIIDLIRSRLSVSTNSKSVKSLHNELLDVAVVVHLRKGMYNIQDIDNVAEDVDVQISTHGTFGVHPESASIVIEKVGNF